MNKVQVMEKGDMNMVWGKVTGDMNMVMVTGDKNVVMVTADMNVVLVLVVGDMNSGWV